MIDSGELVRPLHIKTSVFIFWSFDLFQSTWAGMELQEPMVAPTIDITSRQSNALQVQRAST